MRRTRLFLTAACLALPAAHAAPPPLSELEIPKELEKAARADYAPIRHSTFSADVASVVATMPQGGGYASTSKANAGLAAAIALDSGGHLVLKPELAMPAYCSGATYLVFLMAVERLQHEGRLHLPANVMTALLMQRQTDGVGIWGRWNANGPGTACLFNDLRLGRNFTLIDEAQEGDFAKFWWSEEIGAKEHGHSVVFMGRGVSANGEPTVTFWSANIPGGYGLKTIPRSQIRRALFSRLENPQALETAPTLAPKDPYLADMLKRSSSEEEMERRTGLPKGESGLNALPAPRTAARKPTTPIPTVVATPLSRKRSLF